VSERGAWLWLGGTALGVLMTIGLGVGLLVLRRVLPPGRSRELVGFVPDCISLLRNLRSDQRLPPRCRLALSAALGYNLSPIQLIPNCIPVIGQIDNVVVLTVALRYSCRKLPRARVVGSWHGTSAFLARLLGPPRF
jgi:uncharacterized membrane protein YkvA (DUF1232 family)